MFGTLTKGLENTLRTLSGRGRLSEKNIEDAVREVKMSLLAADVNIGVVKDFVAGVKANALGERVLKSLTPAEQFIGIVYEELKLVLGDAVQLDLNFRPPVVVMLVGLQGSGKTTTAAKLARHLVKKSKRCYLVPADLRRPAAVRQLEILGEKIAVDVHPAGAGAKAINVVEDALNRASRMGYDVVLIDTAGRLHVDEHMMQELREIHSSTQAGHVLFVADAMTGQDAVKSAGAFHESLPLTGVILTKLEGDARGGAALSIRKVTGVPILFAGVGEKLEDLEVFWPDRMASRILGKGDVLTLVEKAAADVDPAEVKRIADRATGGKFSLEDLKDQLRSIKKMGSAGKLLGMLPGFGSIKDKLHDADIDSHLKRNEAIINSMTPEERRRPKILNGSRRKRIAVGSGTEVSDVNKLVREFEMMQKMMKKFGRGGLGQMMKLFGS